jgi:hypothetical protein
MNEETLIRVLDGVGWFAKTARKRPTAYSIKFLTGFTPVTNRKYLNECARRKYVTKVNTSKRQDVERYEYGLTDLGWKVLKSAGKALI